MLSALIHRRRALQAIGGVVVAQNLVGSAQAKPEGFNVFFDFGKRELSPSAMPLIDAIRSTVKSKARVTIAGHCDTAESEPGKLGLTRAVEVLKALAEPGLPAGVQFTVLNNVAANQMVKTGPNTKEPQNRRVVITVD
jgi:OOP family OmpA-OmpF porin